MRCVADQRRRWLVVEVWAVLALLVFAQRGVWAQAGDADEAADKPTRKWALLIGIEKYHRANPLRYTVNDVRRITETLCRRGDYREDDVMEIVDSATNPRFQPLRTSIQAEIPVFLQKPGPSDHILVYFSGHGFRDKDGKLYLAPIDCDPANAAATGIAVEWFREQLARCKAKTKLLVLDACHAGSEKGDDDQAAVSAKDLGTLFRDLEGVVTLASSTSDEKSLIWEEKEQSLFSYWFNQGLRGQADVNGDNDVTIDELFDYVYRNVTQAAKMRFPRGQTPVRIVRSGTRGVPVMVHLRPQRLKQVLTDMAEQLAWALEARKIPKVGVLEFTSNSKLGELLGADFGALGQYCAEELERRMSALASGKFTLLDRRRLQAALKAKSFGVSDLASDTALKGLSKQAGGLPVIAVGTLRNRSGQILNLECKLLHTDQDDQAGMASGLAALSESEWAMVGRSVEVRPEDRRPPRPAQGDKPPVAPEAQFIARLDQRAQGAHPLLDASFPYRVKIMVKGNDGEVAETKPVFQGNDMYVGLRKGDVYEIWVENRTQRKCFMRLLVDGLNTRPQRIVQKMMTIEERPAKRPAGGGDYQMAARVNLGDAAAWILDPSSEAAVRGFFSTPDSDAKLREFLVTDAQDSLAARQNFTDQLGMITAAFYNFKAASRGMLGTTAGKERTEKVELEDAPDVGNLLAVVTIRYVEPAALDKLR